MTPFLSILAHMAGKPDISSGSGSEQGGGAVKMLLCRNSSIKDEDLIILSVRGKG